MYVDKRRVRVAYAAAGERYLVRRALTAFRAEVATMERTAESAVILDTECDKTEEGIALP